MATLIHFCGEGSSGREALQICSDGLGLSRSAPMGWLSLPRATITVALGLAEESVGSPCPRCWVVWCPVVVHRPCNRFSRTVFKGLRDLMSIAWMYVSSI
jgi:hypothetical protein